MNPGCPYAAEGVYSQRPTPLESGETELLMARVIDWPGRMQELAEFVGLDQKGLELIQATREVVLTHGEELTASVYDNFLSFPESRRFFSDEHGSVNEERLTRRKHSLMRWLRGSIDFQMDEDYPIRVLAMGIVHSHPPLHRSHLGSVPARFMIGTISYIQSAVADLLRRELADPDLAMQATSAWNKMLMLQLDIMLAGYVTEVPNEPAPGGPQYTGPGAE